MYVGGVCRVTLQSHWDVWTSMVYKKGDKETYTIQKTDTVPLVNEERV